MMPLYYYYVMTDTLQLLYLIDIINSNKLNNYYKSERNTKFIIYSIYPIVLI